MSALSVILCNLLRMRMQGEGTERESFLRKIGNTKAYASLKSPGCISYFLWTIRCMKENAGCRE